jgi:hypothetical protein
MTAPHGQHEELLRRLVQDPGFDSRPTVPAPAPDADTIPAPAPDEVDGAW